MNIWPFLLLFSFFTCFDQSFETQTSPFWNPDAGLILSYTHKAKLTVSSGESSQQNIIDGDAFTSWQSDAPLPSGYISRYDQNVLLNFIKNQGDKKATDGNLNTVATVKSSETSARFEFSFNVPQFIKLLSLKCNGKAPIHIEAFDRVGEGIFIGTITSSENFQLVQWKVNKTIQKLTVSSTAPFNIFEIAALEDDPKEFALFDFGGIKSIGTIYSKHWAGKGMANATKILLSEDGMHWQQVADLNPDAENNQITNVHPEVSARYLKVEHSLNLKDWNKVFLWEVAVYDKNGHYGPVPEAEKSTVSFNELVGVNAVWGWGHNKYSDLLEKGQGSDLYNKVASYARNYHDMSWDIKQPKQAPDYKKMASGEGTHSQWWLNWDREYKAWEKTGLQVDATLQMHHFKPSEWEFPYESAYQYGYQFATHFGPTKGNGLVETVEVGNEPWKYPAATYRKILFGMAKGIREGDPDIKILPCALQAADPKMENTDIFKNYMGARIGETEATYLDALNIHCYSYIYNEQGTRIAVHPEHPNSSFREIQNAVRFRDHNLPGKKIYLTEWGWDGSGGGEGCTHSECVSEKAAGAYAMRGAMMAWRMGISRAHWFFYANEEKSSSLYTRSGLTGSVKTGFREKRSFRSLLAARQHLGDLHFLEVLQENAEAWIYLLGTKDGQATHIVAWRPIPGDSHEKSIVKFFIEHRPLKATLIDGLTNRGKPLPLPKCEKGMLELEVGALPVIIELAF
ncbi:MAG: discoidin domain-containing protein [Bacteroidetes bacterium]|nr:discoidin domain-containing protein [Bacteroidota bacterium]